ncbi:MAG TPA: hypothetical protein VGX27_09535 [Candidatus Dormibacteraeota bacterium]|nr:hypothetical protein [Candidatus Dormibacteraeota bacterium]
MTTTPPRLRVLLLCDDNPANANTMLDHISAFPKYSRHLVKTFNPRWLVRSRTLDYREFDVVVVHWSLSMIFDHYLHRSFRDRLAAFTGLKVHFLQDDYRWVEKMTAEQRRVGIDVLFTLVSPQHFDKIWTPRLPGVRLVSTLAGYVPQYLLDRPQKPLAERELDIVYRGREVPWWLGRLGQDKVLVGRGVKSLAERAGLKVDIAWTEGDRIYGEKWIQFVNNSRATIGCEGGASITDFDGSIEQSVKAYLQNHPDAPFEEVHAAVLERHEGNVPMNVMTPRLFEAAALRTALVLFPGEYSGVLYPGRHYIALEKDFSNFDSVVKSIRDDDYISELTERTFREVAMAPKNSLRAMVAEFDRVLDEEGRKRAIGPQLGYQMAATQRRMSALAKGQFVNVASRLERLTGSGLYVRLARNPRHYAVKGYVAVAATLRSRVRMTLLLRSIVPTGVKKERPRFDVLLEDMLKIDILDRANHGRLTAGVVFQTWPHLHPDGTLELRSALAGEADSGAADADAVVRGLRNGEVTSVLWNHSRIANTVSHPLSKKEWVTVWLGEDGRHDFVSLRYLLRIDRQKAVNLITPTLAIRPRQPGPAARKSAPHAPFRIPIPRVTRYVRHPIHYAGRAQVLTMVLLSSRSYRTAIARYFGDTRLRSAVPLSSFLGDLVRLDELKKACAGGQVLLERDPPSGRWSYVSARPGTEPASSGGPLASCAPSRITWDHSAVSDRFTMRIGLGRLVEVGLGPGGVHEFKSFAVMAQADPRFIEALLPVPQLGGRKGNNLVPA